MVETLSWEGKSFGSDDDDDDDDDKVSYVAMGQVCVPKKYSGQYGVFAGLYQEMARRLFLAGYSVIVTAISLKNERSVRAHEKIRFVEIHKSDTEWVIVGLGI